MGADEGGSLLHPARTSPRAASHRRALRHALAQVAHDVLERGWFSQKGIGPLAQAFEFPG